MCFIFIAKRIKDSFGDWCEPHCGITAASYFKQKHTNLRADVATEGTQKVVSN